MGDVGDGILEGGGQFGQFAVARGLRPFDGEDGQRGGEPRLLHSLEPMGQFDVGDLVGEHRRRFLFGGAQPQHAARDEDEAAGGGEGVDFLGVQDLKMIAAEGFRSVRGPRQRRSEQRDIPVGRLVVPCRVAGGDLCGDGSAEVVLLLRRDVLEGLGERLGTAPDGVGLRIGEDARELAHGGADFRRQLDGSRAAGEEECGEEE